MDRVTNVAPNIFYVAEISANHLGSLDRAHNLIDLAASAGASAIKLQTYKPETMTLPLKEFAISKHHELWGGVPLYQLYKEAMTPWEWHEELFEHAREVKLEAFSSPFDSSAVDFLESLDCQTYKIASMETGDVDLISYAASKGKRMIISTGASTLEEIEDAVNAAENVRDKLAVLVCTSSYPSDASDAHLNRIFTLKDKFKVEVGISDHTLGIGVSVAAIALGATIVEKHLTIKRSDGGHDAAFSLEPDEFKLLVEEGNKAEASLGAPKWSFQDSEAESRRLRRSLFIVKPVNKGEIATRENVKALRPNMGGPIKDINQIMGKRFKKNYQAGDAASLDCVE
ncbi:MAG: pseudaminic acid synthase [Bacteroidetes bacterium]|nr:pseudaminic acid synthase [Bacteroidota bacterium]